MWLFYKALESRKQIKMVFIRSRMKKNNNNHLIIYQDDNGLVKVNVRFADEDVWLTQGQLAKIYDTTQLNIALHIKNIYTDYVLKDMATHKKYLLV